MDRRSFILALLISPKLLLKKGRTKRRERIGFTKQQFLDAGYFYAPYIPLFVPPVMYQ